MSDRKVTVNEIKVDTRPRCKSRGDYLGHVVPCDHHRGHAGRHRWVRAESFYEVEWTDRKESHD